jgi:hypothetical protein
VIRRGLEKTEDLWPAVRQGFDLLKQVAQILGNEERLTGEQVRGRFLAAVERMKETAEDARQAGQEKLAVALEHFVKVSAVTNRGYSTATT